MPLLFRSAVGSAIVMFALVSPTCIVSQSTVGEYQRFFVQRADQRSHFEKALNLIGKTGFPVGRSFALIAGVTQYPNFPKLEQSLKPAAVDIQKLQTYLKEQEFFDEIVVLKDGDMSLANLNYFLENYFPERLAESPHSRFLFAYSGHGYSVKTGGGTVRGYLLTSPAVSLSDPVNRLDLDVLRTMLNPVIDSAEKVLVLINSCDSGAFLGRKGFGPNPLGPGDRGAHAIMASRSEQQSLHLDAVGPGSVFFEKIFAGLGGPADNSPADGVVTYHELDTYLHQEVPYATNGSQSPMEGDISRDGSVGEFFFLNRARQLSFGNAPPWNPKSAVAFGVAAEDLLPRARTAYQARRYTEARELFIQAADAQNGEAMNYLGYMYTAGIGVTQDYDAARQWYAKAAAAGNASGMYGLGYLYEHGDGVTQDYGQARQWYEKGAAAGSAEAMNNLGSLFYYGHGVTQDYGQAREWYEKAAAAGNAMAMYDLGSLYDYGLGATRDYVQARQWYEKAAAAGSAEAMNNLGTLYYLGHGVTQDYGQARQWYEKGAAAGNPSAMYGLGSLYEHGYGVTLNYGQARQWYEKGAAAGNADAMNNIGSLYYFGHGVTQDYGQARQWYEKAAAAGSAAAMYGLGYLYERGEGVTQDYAQTRQWYQKAAAAGYADAKKRLEQLPK